MTDHVFFDPDLEWLDHVQPIGLVVASTLVKDLGLVPERQTQAESAVVAELIEEDPDKPALRDSWTFVERVLGWEARHVAGVPGGLNVPEELSLHLPEHETTLSPTWAVRELGSQDQTSWQLLVSIEPTLIDPDERGALAGWEATAQQRFERLLRETGVFAGVLITAKELRLVYAPRGETSGWLRFPLRELASVSGRAMLGGLKLVLGAYRLFNDADDRRLPALLKRSRDAQAAVSTALAEQVLGALHELLRGLDHADPDLIRGLAKDRPAHLYEGLLTVLMRLVFILYAEDRDLIPSRTDAEARSLYEQNYSVRGLFAKLLQDAALNPDTMDERLGGWGWLLALFRLVHKGDGANWIKGRGGKLFDPDVFPFLEGRPDIKDDPRVIKLTDGCVLRILESLMTIESKRGSGSGARVRERLSYRTLDVEQIGSVYETVMGFTVERSGGSALAIRAGKKNSVPVYVDLDKLAAEKPNTRLKHLKEETGRDKFGARVETGIKAATSVADLIAAFASVVDKRGSPDEAPVGSGAPILQPTDERRRTGSHYTPRTLTEPIVRHALEPAFERLGENAKPENILELKVCDPAMGSGAFLVEACRQLAARLVKAWSRWPETRPKIPQDEDEDLHARRLVAQRCLYGVDKNHMATDLARLSLWLATLARDHEFEFVDHALKTGDSLVGLTNEQIAAANWDETKTGLPLFKSLVKDRVTEALKVRREIQEAPDDVHRMIQEVRQANLDKRLDPVRTMGDAVLSAFFAGAKPRPREKERARIESLITGSLELDLPKLTEAGARLHQGEHPIRPFHWQLEFPEVFQRKNPGFDAIIGNPPFLGGRRISNELGFTYNEWLESLHSGASRNADLVAHFFRRAFEKTRKNGVFGLIATNTIGQGDTRATGLTPILGNGGAIYHAVRRLRWPGEAAVVVSVVHVRKGSVVQPILDGRPMHRISAYLVEGDLDLSPKVLAANARKAFQGSILLGMGFTFDDEAAAKGMASSLGDMQRLIAANPKNAERILPYIGGEEINNDPQQRHHRYVIDFFDRPLERDSNLGSWFNRTGTDQASCLTRGVVPTDYPGECAEDWPDLIEIVREKVKPERDIQKRQALRERWWQYADKRPGLYRAIFGLSHVLVTGAAAVMHHMIAILPAEMVFSHKTIVFPITSLGGFAAMQSSAHELWSRAFGTTFGSVDALTYNPTQVFRTFPFPQNYESSGALELAAQAYHNHRAGLMVRRNEGLTKTYNRFHDRGETAPDIVRLRELHTAIDSAVLRAYGWVDLSEGVKAEHLKETTEDDHKYQNRFFWPASIRDEVLARLLSLNGERAEEERKAGLTAAGTEDDEEEFGEDTEEGGDA